MTHQVQGDHCQRQYQAKQRVATAINSRRRALNIALNIGDIKISNTNSNTMIQNQTFGCKVGHELIAAVMTAKSDQVGGSEKQKDS